MIVPKMAWPLTPSLAFKSKLIGGLDFSRLGGHCPCLCGLVVYVKA
jgi:hypothetical protein